MSEAMNFEELSEADVREEIIAPLLRGLGYRSGDQHNVIRDQSLRYPRALLDRADLKKDPLLRGKADYILEAGGKVRWVIEVKSPDTELGPEAIEQAWAYAQHPGVQAVYFALCNGRRIDVFQTKMGPGAGPVLALDYAALGQSEGYQKIEGLLAPTAVLRDHPEPRTQSVPPLGPGLRPVERITNGMIRYESNSLNHPALNQIRMEIDGGALERDEQGRLIAYLRTLGPTRTLQESNQRLGFSAFEMTCADGTLSTVPERRNVFVYDRKSTLPAGEDALDLSTWRTIKLPVTLHVHVRATAAGVLKGREMAGEFTTDLDFEQQMKVRMSGSFLVHLA
jgi:hypothetical protein